ncbi:3279_t:CDS:1, partial [Cetraspora pellucida]
IYVKSQENNPCLSFKNKIINSLYEDNYDINENFITKAIHDDHDHFKRNIMNLEKINTYLKEFNEATNDILHENCHKLFII